LDFAILRFLSWELPFSALALRYTLGSSALCVSDFTINFFGNCWFEQLAYLVSAYFCFSILFCLGYEQNVAQYLATHGQFSFWDDVIMRGIGTVGAVLGGWPDHPHP
jgi:hypothetical protein